jgi:hypothetical protein
MRSVVDICGTVRRVRSGGIYVFLKSSASSHRGARAGVEVGAREPGLTRTPRARRVGLAAVALMVVSLLGTPGMARAALSWSRVVSLNAPSIVFGGVACPSATQCTVVDAYHGEVTFDPLSVGSPPPFSLDRGRSVQSVACPSAKQCTAVDMEGREVTFGPTAPQSAHSVVVDRSGDLGGVACPSDRQCTALDFNGREVTFDPRAPGKLVSTHSIDDGNENAAVACPSTHECIIVGGGGYEATFNPRSPAESLGATSTIDPNGGDLGALACPTTTQCTAVDDQGAEITFDPSSPQSARLVTIDSDFNNELQGISCPSTSLCVAVDVGGNALSGDPDGSEAWAIAPIDLEGENEGGQLDSVFCSSAAECTAADTKGNAVVGTEGPVSTKAPTRTQLKALLVPTLTPHGSAATIRARLTHGGYSVSFASPSGGQLVIDWRQAHEHALVARATTPFYKPATAHLKIRLTSAGRGLLEHAGRLELTAYGAFRLNAENTTSATATFTLKR